MRACKSQCSLFKEMYVTYKKGQIDSEMKLLMEQHRKECTYCKEWSTSIDEDREDKSGNIQRVENSQSKTRSILEKLKVTLVIGLSFILFVGLFLSGFLKS